MSDRSFITTFLRMGGCLLLSGCAYHAGYPIDQYGIKTIYVKPAVKEAIGAQLSGVLTAQIREEILRNGFIRITDQKETADAILETTITDYNRGISVTDEEDDEKAKSLSLSATVKYKLTDNHTGKTISDSSASGSVSISATTNAQAIEYQRTPQLTRSIAKQIAQHIVLKEKPKETKKEENQDENDEENLLSANKEIESKDDSFSTEISSDHTKTQPEALGEHPDLTEEARREGTGSNEIPSSSNDNINESTQILSSATSPTRSETNLLNASNAEITTKDNKTIEADTPSPVPFNGTESHSLDSEKTLSEGSSTPITTSNGAEEPVILNEVHE